jgi:hypothetical protein
VKATINRRGFVPLLFGSLIAATASTALAHAPSGAIFTTVADGSEVNFNIYPSKDAVYLDGGRDPALAGRCGARRRYVCVPGDSIRCGKTLLSTDAARCRQFVVTGGVITSVVATGCSISPARYRSRRHHGAAHAYADTPNNGGPCTRRGSCGWTTSCGVCCPRCRQRELSAVDCGQAPGNLHGFVPRTPRPTTSSRPTNNLEIDTRFIDDVTGATLAAERPSGPTLSAPATPSTRTTIPTGRPPRISRTSRRWRSAFTNHHREHSLAAPFAV